MVLEQKGGSGLKISTAEIVQYSWLRISLSPLLVIFFLNLVNDLKALTNL